MECPDYIPLFPPGFSSPWFPTTGLSSLHDQVRPLAHVVAARSRIAPRHVPGHSLLDLVAKNSPRLALRRSLLRLLRTVLFRLHPVSLTKKVLYITDTARTEPVSGAPSLFASANRAGLLTEQPLLGGAGLQDWIKAQDSPEVKWSTYFRSESSTASACATRPADMLFITSFVKKNFPSAGTIMICNLSDNLSAMILLI